MRPAQTASTNLQAVASAQEVTRLWLYELFAPAGTLYFAQSRENKTYQGQTWIAAPIRHGGLNENSSGKIDSLTIDIGNLNRDISALVELHNGLKGCKVRVLQVFALDDPDAYVEDIYYIDSARLKGAAAQFTLSSRFDLMDATIAPRVYGRTFCHWDYKGRGCWRGEPGAWTQPSGFVAGDPDACNKTPEDCKRHGNYQRIGCFPSVPFNKVIRA